MASAGLEIWKKLLHFALWLWDKLAFDCRHVMLLGELTLYALMQTAKNCESEPVYSCAPPLQLSGSLQLRAAGFANSGRVAMGRSARRRISYGTLLSPTPFPTT